MGTRSQGTVPLTPTPPLPPRVLLLSLRPRWLHGRPRRPARHWWQVRGVSPAKQGHSAGHSGYRRAGGSRGTVLIAPEPAGSDAAVPAALAARAACQPRPAAGLQHDNGDRGGQATLLTALGGCWGSHEPGKPHRSPRRCFECRGARGPWIPLQPPLIYDLHCRHRAGGDPGPPLPAGPDPTHGSLQPHGGGRGARARGCSLHKQAADRGTARAGHTDTLTRRDTGTRAGTRTAGDTDRQRDRHGEPRQHSNPPGHTHGHTLRLGSAHTHRAPQNTRERPAPRPP